MQSRTKKLKDFLKKLDRTPLSKVLTENDRKQIAEGLLDFLNDMPEIEVIDASKMADVLTLKRCEYRRKGDVKEHKLNYTEGDVLWGKVKFGKSDQAVFYNYKGDSKEFIDKRKSPKFAPKEVAVVLIRKVEDCHMGGDEHWKEEYKLYIYIPD